jgi:chromosomal replication initiator protein
LTTSELEVVAALAQAIRQRIGEPRYNLWFAHKTKFIRDSDLLRVGVPNRFYQEWLEKTFAEPVRTAAEEVFGQAMQVHFTIDAELFQAARRSQEETTEHTEDTEERQNEKQPTVPPSGSSLSSMSFRSSVVSSPRPAKRTRRWHRLDDFVVGGSNRVAHASAVSVVESPGQGANPLVLHGPVGTGKTHLLEGIYAGLRKHHPDWRVCFITAEDFTNRFVQAMRLGKLASFRKQFRECDTFLVDDLHFLAGKKATLEEFLHTFDALQVDGRQVVVTCDCHPRLTEQFTPEMTDRLLGGAVWSLLPPDADTRLALLRSKTIRDGKVLVPDEVLRFLAERLRGNVRELLGALHSVQHYSRVAHRPVDLALAREALSELLRHSVRVVQIVDVESAVCRVLRLDRGALQSKQRSWQVSHPRMLAMFLARKHTTATYAEIGQYFGGRNHSTVVAAEKKIRQGIQDNGELLLGERPVRVRELVELVERELLR